MEKNIWSTKDLIILGVILFAVFFGFFAGWVFPVEGPVDYIYDERIGNKTIKKPVVNVPAQKPQKEYLLDGADVEDIKEILIDLNEDGEQEWYLFLPLMKGN